MAHAITRNVQPTRLIAPIRAQIFLIISNITLRLVDLIGISYHNGSILNHLQTITIIHGIRENIASKLSKQKFTGSGSSTLCKIGTFSPDCKSVFDSVGRLRIPRASKTP
jgi:hypothetical protein